MSVSLVRSLGVVGFAVVLAGCASSPKPVVTPQAQCQLNRSSCLYEGSYEPGEREYAEREAARLNQASSRRLRRS